MTQEHQIVIMAVVVSAILLCLAIHALAWAAKFRQEILRDDVRFRLGAARDKLYLAAARGQLEVPSDAFRGLHDIINRLLQHSDDAGGAELFAITVGLREASDSALEKRLATMSASQRDLYLEVAYDVATAILLLFRLNSRLFRIVSYLRRIASSIEARETMIPKVERSVGEVRRLHDAMGPGAAFGST